MTRSAVRVVFVSAVLLAAVASGSVVAADTSHSELGSETFAQTDVDADRVVLELGLQEDGAATWEVSYRVELATENETAAFEQLQSDIEANTSTYLAAFRDRMGRTARTAENATGRSMTIENLTVETDTERLQGYGTVTYRFRWTNFAAIDGDTIRSGDALAGFFLEEDARLTVTWPDGYEIDSVSPEPDDRRDRTVVWQGPIEFGTDGPQVVASPASSFPTLAVVVVAAGLVVGVGIGAWRRRTRDDGASDDQPVAGTVTEPDTDTDSSESASESPETLLSNEERVLRLLDERGGRIKQQEVATELDWTDAKTSQVVKTLREDDRIDVFRLGRENVLVDPEESEL